MTKQNSIKILLHLLFWIGWILFFNKITVLEIIQDIEILDGDVGEIDKSQNSYINAFPLILAGVMFKALLSYLIIFWIKKKLLNTNKFYMVLASIVCIAFVFSFESFIDRLIIKESSVYEDIHFELWKNSNYLQYFILTIIIFSYLVIERLNDLDKKYLNMEKEKLQSELSFLKYQLNPHLLFNTLNNLFSMSQAHNADDVSDGILKLSGIMRYMLYENKEAKIALTKEIDFLKQYIDLQKLRVSDEKLINVNFTVDGAVDLVKIPSFILVPFVENAFKHGINIKKESQISIHLKVVNKKLVFEVMNSIFRTQKKLSKNEGGIGISNLKKRLELLYPNSYLLEQFEKDGMYFSTLEIDL